MRAAFAFLALAALDLAGCATYPEQEAAYPGGYASPYDGMYGAPWYGPYPYYYGFGFFGRGFHHHHHHDRDRDRDHDGDNDYDGDGPHHGHPGAESTGDSGALSGAKGADSATGGETRPRSAGSGAPMADLPHASGGGIPHGTEMHRAVGIGRTRTGVVAGTGAARRHDVRSPSPSHSGGSRGAASHDRR